MSGNVVTMEKIVALCKRRGFIFPSSEIYGGVGSTYDYGHYGVLLKGNVKGEWWRAMLQERDDIVAIDSAILQHPRVWEASGHLAGFTDPLIDCKTCGQRFRADHLAELPCGRKPSKHPGETDECELTEARDFNLMFETTIGPVKESGSAAYLRPETAQGIFINFKNVLQFSRKKPPFGIAQVGKSFRNEITPGNFIFRTREFEQMEMEFFVPPAEAPRWFEHWLAERERWYVDLGIRPQQLRLRAHDADELSHYSSGTSDVEYLFPIGWSELEGIANRGDFDLSQHAEHSGEKLEYFDQSSGERYVPHVIEPAAGADRATLAFLVDAYDEELVEREGAGEGDRSEIGQRTVLRLHPRLAPIKAAVLPLVRKDGRDLPRAARPSGRGHGRVRRRRFGRQALSPPGRDRHAVLPDRRPSEPRGRNRDAARARLAHAGAPADRGADGGDRAARERALENTKAERRMSARSNTGAHWRTEMTQGIPTLNLAGTIGTPRAGVAIEMAAQAAC
jgi:glycyl-tRNA synthetase